MMTVIEKQYMDAVIAMNRRLQSSQPDWEQRRYEIAKDAMCAGPYQGHIWRGAYIPLPEVRVGERCPIHHPPHINFGYLKYRVERIDKECKEEKLIEDET